MDKERLSGLIFLDLKKAFDCRDHKTLLRKLTLFGILGTTLNLFQSYLTNRIQRCKVDHTTSKQKIIRCGFSQGSNMGPLLFLICINDLPNCLGKSTANMFTDDANLTTSSPSIADIETNLNEVLEHGCWLISLL